MEEAIFPPSPGWFLPNIISTREDGSICYGSKNNIVILKASPNLDGTETSIIQNAHSLRVSSVAFSPSISDESIQNTIASCSIDGFVKLWRIDSLSAIMGHKSHWEGKEEIGNIICLDWSLANPHQVLSVADNNSIVSWDVLANTTTKFTFQKLGATVIACCPFNQKIVAVGAKTGEVYVLNLTKSGNIIFKLRGHDNKIHSLTWCPLPYNVFNSSEFHQEFLLASACQDKEIYVWRAGSDGKCEIKFQIPTCSISKSQVCRKLGNSFSYAALFWADPYRIFSATNFGELIYFDIMSYMRSKCLMSGTTGQKLPKQLSGFFKLGHCFHSKGLFAIAPVASPLVGSISLFGISEKKLDSKFEIQSKWKILSESENEEEILKWMAATIDRPRLLWTAGQDRKLVACDSKDLKMVFNYNTVNGSVYCAVVSPHDPNKIAIGVGDGMIRLWNLTDPNGEIEMYWQKIKDRVMSLAWHPSRDGLLAYGTSEGRVGLIDTNSNKPPNVFKPSHPKPIYNLSWGPQLPSERTEDLKSEFNLYSVGDNALSVYNPSKLRTDPANLSDIIQFPCKKQTDVCWKPDHSLMAVGNEDGSICLVEPSQFKIVHTVQAYKRLVESIAWHPSSTSLDSDVSPYHGYFASGSTDNDNEIRVFNCRKTEEGTKVDQVAALRGHFGHIQSVSWSPHVGGRLISSSSDSSVQIWDVVSQHPLVNFCPNGMPLFSVWSPIDSDIVLTGCRKDVLCVWRVSKQTKICPTSEAKTKKQKKEKKHNLQQINGTPSQKKETEEKINEIAVIGEENGILEVAVPEDKTSGKSSRELKRFAKAWKGDANDLFQSCYSRLKNDNKKEEMENYSLSFLCDRDCWADFIKTEEESYQRAHNWNEYYELSVWKGDLEKVLKEKIKTGQLNDFLVSLAPSVSTRLWADACLSYSKTLEEKKSYRKAASYLVACRKIYEAIQLLTDANLHLEALCIARSFLPVEDPIIKSIVNEHARWLFKNGAYLKACECYIYTESYSEVAKICGIKSQPEYLSLAALAAKKCGSVDLESLEATNAVLKCFESNDLDLAKRICDDHCNLKHLVLMYNMYRTVYQLDGGELSLEKDILTVVRETTQTEDVEFPSSTRQFYNKYAFYKFKRQMLIVVAQELCFACCEKEPSNVLTHLVKALNTCCRYIQTSENEVHPLFKLCTWLSPDGFLSRHSYFTSTGRDLLPKVKSLRGFLCSAIARSLNDGLSSTDVGEYLNILSEVMDDLLDGDSYKYFKNLIEVEICEKRLLSDRDRIAKSKLANGKDKLSCGSPKGAFTNGVKETDGVSGDSENVQDGFENLEQSPKKVTEGEDEEIVDSDSVAENEECSQSRDVLEEKILQDTAFLKGLKAEIESFETSRISSPNPVPYYSMLKKFLEEISENDLARSLLERLEKKWFELN